MWQRWQLPNKKWFMHPLAVNQICEDMHGYPCVVKMETVRGRRLKFSRMDYTTVVREMVTGLCPRGQRGEWDEQDDESD